MRPTPNKAGVPGSGTLSFVALKEMDEPGQIPVGASVYWFALPQPSAAFATL